MKSMSLGSLHAKRVVARMLLCCELLAAASLSAQCPWSAVFLVVLWSTASCALTAQIIVLSAMYSVFVACPVSSVLSFAPTSHLSLRLSDVVLSWLLSGVGLGSAIGAAALRLPNRELSFSFERSFALSIDEAAARCADQLDSVQFLSIRWLPLWARKSLSAAAAVATELCLLPGAAILFFAAALLESLGGSFDFGQVGDNGLVVALVHGHGANVGQYCRGIVSLALHAEMLDRKVCPISVVCVNFELESFLLTSAGPEQGVSALAEVFVKGLEARVAGGGTGGALLLVGHSLGGLVSAVVAEAHAPRLSKTCGLEVVGVVALSAPFRGSHLLHVLRSRRMRALAPLARVGLLPDWHELATPPRRIYTDLDLNSAMTCQLRGQVEKNERPTHDFTCLSGSWDPMVLPSSAFWLPKKRVTSTVELQYDGHYSPAINDLVWATVRQRCSREIDKLTLQQRR